MRQRSFHGSALACDLFRPARNRFGSSPAHPNFPLEIHPITSVTCWRPVRQQVIEIPGTDTSNSDSSERCDCVECVVDLVALDLEVLPYVDSRTAP